MVVHREIPSADNPRLRLRGGSRDPAAHVVVRAPIVTLDREALTALADDDHEVVVCDDDRALLEAVVRRPPAAVVFGFQPRSAADLGLLQLLRRVAPETPLILLACEDTLESRRAVAGLRPIYFAVCPVDVAELRDAVADAIEVVRRQRRAPWILARVVG